jgi:hypothetical protein
MSHLDALIVSSADDYHARVVAQEVEKLGCRSLILDTAAYPARYELCATLPFSGPIVIRDRHSNECWEIDDSCGVWWRRPRSHAIPGRVAHPKLRTFAVDESRQSLLGALLARCPNFFNQVGASRQATIKPYQLALADAQGFKVPTTSFGNDPEQAKRFVSDRKGSCIYKPFTGTDFGFFETRRFDLPKDLDELWRIEYCPVQIQDYVPGNFDLRVTVVGTQVFTAAVDLTVSKHGVDSRVERLPTAPFELPGDVEEKISALVSRMGLKYAALDLRLGLNKELTFFELNPEGQYLWIEIDTGLPISAALARALTANARSPIGKSPKAESEAHPA